jgi:hypothetical protein
VLVFPGQLCLECFNLREKSGIRTTLVLVGACEVAHKFFLQFVD